MTENEKTTEFMADQAANLTDTVTAITPWFFGKADETVVYAAALMSMQAVASQVRRKHKEGVGQAVSNAREEMRKQFADRLTAEAARADENGDHVDAQGMRDAADFVLSTIIKTPDASGAVDEWRHMYDNKKTSDQRMMQLSQLYRENQKDEDQRTVDEMWQQYEQKVADLIAERDGWQETARHYAQGQEFYHDIVRQAGEHFGIEARTSYDGSVQDDVIALKVPELVGDMVKANSNRGET